MKKLRVFESIEIPVVMPGLIVRILEGYLQLIQYVKKATGILYLLLYQIISMTVKRVARDIKRLQ